MPKKDVCYVNTKALEPQYLKGQIVAIKEPDSAWSDIECGKKKSDGSKMRYSVKTLVVAKTKLNPPSDKRLVIIKKNGKDFVDLVQSYVSEKE